MRKQLRKVSLVICAIALLAMVSIDSAYSEDWESVKTVNGKKNSLKINKKTRAYWKLRENRATTVVVIGPAKLKVISRATIPDGKKEVVYGFISKEDGKNRTLIGRGTSLSKGVVNPKNKSDRLGESRSILYDVPDGEHTYKFTLPDDQISDVYVRFFITAVKPKNVPYIAYLPQKYHEEARITVNEREYIYYKVIKDKQVELDVIGPTQIKGISRLEYDNTMHGEKTYRVQIINDGRIIATEPFTSNISATASFVETVDRKIGKGDVFYIDVPKGRYKYFVTTPDNRSVIYLRFYIPQDDLGNLMPTDGNSPNNFTNFVRGIVE